MYIFLILVNCVGCLMLAAAEWQHSDLEGTWIDEYGLARVAVFDQYVASIYWALTTVSTVGFGDIHPATNFERGGMLLIESIGVVFFACVMGSITSYIQRINQLSAEAEQFQNKLQAMETWMKQAGVPPLTIRRVCAFFTSLEARVVTENVSSGFITDLPTALKAEVVQSATMGLLEQIDLFADLDPNVIRMLTSKLIPRPVSPGYDIVRESSPNDSLFILQEGKVSVIRHDELVEHVESPSVIGESALLAEVVPEWRLRFRGAIGKGAKGNLWHDPSFRIFAKRGVRATYFLTLYICILRKDLFCGLS